MRRGLVVALSWLFVLPAALAQEKLPIGLDYGLDRKVAPAVQQAEKYLAEGKATFAKTYLQSAESRYAELKRSHAAKFDESHPKIAGLKKRITALRVALGLEKPAENVRPLPKVLDLDLQRDVKLPLEMAVKYAKQGRAQRLHTKLYLGEAEKGYAKLKQQYTTHFDEHHPVIAGYRKQLVDLRKQVGGKAAADLGVVAPKKPVSTTPPAKKALPAGLGYLLDQVDSSVKSAERYIDRGATWLKSVGSFLDSADRKLARARRDFPNDYDARHPRIAGLLSRISGLRTRLAGLTGGKKPATTPTPGRKKKLSAGLAYKLAEVDKGLKSAEQYAARGGDWTINARGMLASAEKKLAAARNSYAREFDPAHAQIAPLYERIATLRKKLSSASPSKPATTPTKPTKPTTTPTRPTTPAKPMTAKKKLSAGLAYQLGVVEKAIASAEQLAARGNSWRPNAISALKAAEKKLAKVRTDYASEFDASHPKIAPLYQRIAAVKEKLSAGGELPKRVRDLLAPVTRQIERAVQLQAGGKKWEAQKALIFAFNHWYNAELRLSSELQNREHFAEIKQLKQRWADVKAKLYPGSTGDPTKVDKPQPPKLPVQGLVERVASDLQQPVGALIQGNNQRAKHHMQRVTMSWKQLEPALGQPAVANHPNVKELKRRLPIVQKMVDEGGSKSAGVASEYKASLESVFAFVRDFGKTYRKADESFNFNNKVDPETVRLSVAALRTLVRDAQAMAAIFREKYGKLGTDFFRNNFPLAQSHRIQRKAKATLQEIDGFPGQWQNFLEWKTDALHQRGSQAMSSLDSALARLKQLKDNPHVRKATGETIAKKAAEIDLYHLLVKVLMPTDEDVPQKLRDKQAFMKKLTALLSYPARAEKVQQEAGKIIKLGASAQAARIARARMPKAKMTGAEWDKVAGEIKQVMARWGQIHQVSIRSDWQARSQWSRYGNRSEWEVFKFLWAYVAIQKPGKKTINVYYMSFRRMKKPGGGYGATRYWGVSGSFEMLPENLGK